MTYLSTEICNIRERGEGEEEKGVLILATVSFY